MKIYIFLIFLIWVITPTFAEKEVLEEKFKTYLRDSEVYGKKQQETILVNGETITIYSPIIDYATLKIKPRSEKIQEALNNPGNFFKKDAEKAAGDFRKFAKDYRSCLNKKKWPGNLECISKLEICFDGNKAKADCNWVYHDVIGGCIASSANQGEGLRICFKENEKMFDSFNRCFDDTSLLELTFEIFGKEAKRRSYYTLDSHFYTHKLGGTRCRFIVMDSSQYRLVTLSSHELGRPDFSAIPLDIYVKDHYIDLLEIQRNTKSQEAKKSESKFQKKWKNKR